VIRNKMQRFKINDKMQQEKGEICQKKIKKERKQNGEKINGKTG